MKAGSRLKQVLQKGHFAVTCEMGPPKSAQIQGMLAKARAVKGYVDAVNVTDCQSAVVRLSSLAGAVHLLREGLEPVLQVTCRDRNRIAIQSDLLGAYSLGIRNVLCLTGDHQRFGNHPTAKGVFDLDSVQLVNIVKGFSERRIFANGEPIKEGAPDYFIGAVENPFSGPLELRVLRLEKKIRAGAAFIQTQAVFDLERFKRFMSLVRDRGLDEKCFILAGVIPPKSERAAIFMRDKVPGISVPDDIVTRLRNAADPKQEGIRIAKELISAVQSIEGVSGVHIMAIGWEEVVPQLVSETGLYPRPA
ncbi:MAG: methylenetetrahydrofolate reductase [Peptococcaceae bacterium]|nr:methylenetetrahydrofolate reductase [Peptococcaceae bacterium]